MLARVLAMALCVSVCLCLSVTSRCSIEMDGWIELVFGRWASCDKRDKLDRRRITELTILPSSDARPLVHHSDRQALSTTRYSPGGQLATDDTCRSGSNAILMKLLRSADTDDTLIDYILTFSI